MEKRKAKSRCIALVGLPASGKTSIGSALARHLGLPFVDLDEQIVAGDSRSIAEIFRVDGEEAFRQLESTCLEQTTRKGRQVVATGGGCVLAPVNRELLMERCTVIWLDLSPESAAVRAGAGSRKSDDGKAGGRQAADQDAQSPAVRPLLADGDIMERMRVLDGIRRPLYRECADIIVEVGDKSPTAIVEELYAALD